MAERVFVLDEDVGVRGFLYDLISEVGFGVLTLPTGRELLDLLQKERPALLIVADTPGEYSGFTLVKKIREFDKDIKIIVLGKESQTPETTELIRQTAVDAYFRKNFQDIEIVKKILSVLQQESSIKPKVQKQWGRVLVVDDEDEVRATVKSYLSRRGFDVVTAASGEECLQNIREKSFDVILLDITMGGMDGLLTLKHIMDFNNEAKVIMVTAVQNVNTFSQAKAIGAVDYIIKPFNFGTLEATLLSVLLAAKARPDQDA